MAKQEVRRWSTEKTIAAYICWPIIKICHFCQQILAVFIPVKKNKIAVYSHARKGYSDNPKYIVEGLLKDAPEEYEIFWITQYPETCRELENKGIKVIKSFSWKHFLVHFTARILISNDSLYKLYIKRKDQLYINTWHGAINYKKIGYVSLEFPQKIQEIYFRMGNLQPDVYIAGSEFFVHDTAESFGFDEKVFVHTGLPRNDLFFKHDVALIDSVRDKVNIPKGYKVLLYAPTFRSDYKAYDFGIDYKGLINCLKEKYGGKWVILYRSHYFLDEKLENIPEEVIDVSEYDDMQELLYISDILISDYSSCMWDFSLTGRPCFVFATDMENYMDQDRSFAYLPSKWPYMIAENNDELLDNIVRFDERKYQENLTRHHREAGAYDKGHAVQDIVNIIGNYCNITQLHT